MESSIMLNHSKKTPGDGIIPYCMIACMTLVHIAVGCGLPQATLLEKPERLSKVHPSDDSNQPPLPSTVIAFGFPNDDTDIIGYSIYYKVYYSDTADSDYRDDENHFDEDSYIGTDNEMQPGDAIPDKRGFLKLGVYGKAEFEEYYIRHDGSQEAVYIDFNSGDNDAGATDANEREEPIIGYDYPVTKNNKVKDLARGFIDPRDRSESTKTNPGDKFRSFVNDWAYSGDGYTDGDLRRGYYLLAYQPGREIKDIENCGKPYFQKDDIPVTLKIGFVVHSYGRIQGSLKPVTSKPVYFGEVPYSPVHARDRD